MADEQLNVLVTVNFERDIIDRFQEISGKFHIMHRPARMHTDIVKEVWAQADILYTGGIFPPEAEMMPRLKWAQLHSAGADRALLHSLVTENPDLLLTTTRGIHATTMAEYALGFLLMFGHRIPQMMQAQAAKTWEDDRYEKYLPQQLRGSTVGIVGYGAIGREVARLVKLMGGNVLATKRNPKIEADRDHFHFPDTGDPDGRFYDRLYPGQAVGTMVRNCDFVVITVPLTPKTENSFNAEVIGKMKAGAYLINIGRGGIVDEAALIEALREGHLGGAAFDVFAEEPIAPDSPLWTTPNLIITPHVAGNTHDYHEKAAAVFEENLRRYAEGEPLWNVVNRDEGY